MSNDRDRKPFERLVKEFPFLWERLEKGREEHGCGGVDVSMQWVGEELRQEYTDVGFYIRELLAYLCPKDGEPKRVFCCGTTEYAVEKLVEAGHYPIRPACIVPYHVRDFYERCEYIMRMCNVVLMPIEDTKIKKIAEKLKLPIIRDIKSL